MNPEKLVYPLEVERRLELLVAAGEREAAVETLMREVVHVPEDEIDAIRAQPTWPARVAAAHTITREIRAFFDHTFDPAQAAKILVPVLVLTGSDSPDAVRDDPETVAAALPTRASASSRASSTSPTSSRPSCSPGTSSRSSTTNGERRARPARYQSKP